MFKYPSAFRIIAAGLAAITAVSIATAENISSNDACSANTACFPDPDQSVVEPTTCSTADQNSPLPWLFEEAQQSVRAIDYVVASIAPSECNSEEPVSLPYGLDTPTSRAERFAQDAPATKPKDKKKEDPCQKLGTAITDQCNALKDQVKACLNANQHEIQEFIDTLTEWIEYLKKTIRHIRIAIKIAEVCGQDVKELTIQVTEYEKYILEIEKIIKGLKDKKAPLLPLRKQMCDTVCERLEEKPFKRIACKVACMAGSASCDGMGQGVRVYCSSLPDDRKDIINSILDLLNPEKK